MQKSNYLLVFTTIFFLSLIISCSDKDDTEPQNQQTEQAPTLSTKAVVLPEVMTQSNNPGAQMATTYTNIANGFTGYSGMMVPPAKSSSLKSTLDGEPWVYTWEYTQGTDVFTTTLTVIQTDTETIWTMVINGTLDGIVLDNFLYMEAREELDGSDGEFVMYDPEVQGIGMMTSWLTDGNGVYSVTFEVPNDIIIEMISNPDDSGEISVFEWREIEYLLEFHAEWNNLGHGEYWEYYEGELMDHGTW